MCSEFGLDTRFSSVPFSRTSDSWIQESVVEVTFATPTHLSFGLAFAETIFALANWPKSSRPELFAQLLSGLYVR